MKSQTVMTKQRKMMNGQDSIQLLQNKLYNALTDPAGLGLDPNTFQILQASQPLPNTSAGIWSIFNSLPPKSLSQTFSMSGLNNFYDAYKGVMVTILPQGGDQFRRILGDEYSVWEAYKKSLTPKDVQGYGGILQVFTDWANLVLDPNVATKAITIYTQLQHGIVTEAVKKVLDPDNVDPNLGPKFSQTIADLRAKLDQAGSKKLYFDSKVSSSNVSKTWAKGETSGLFNFFSGGASAAWNKVEQKATDERVTIDIEFDHFTTFAASPQGWYDAEAMNLAYKDKSAQTWPSGQHPTWNETFGKNGNIQRIATELVVFNGMKMTMKSWASYTKTEQQTIEAGGSVDFWPFFSASANAGTSKSVHFDSKGYMEVTTKVDVGNPAILGVNVIPIASIMKFVGMEKRHLVGMF